MIWNIKGYQKRQNMQIFSIKIFERLQNLPYGKLKRSWKSLPKLFSTILTGIIRTVIEFLK